MFGYQYNEILGKIHFWLFMIGANLTFGPMHFLGLQGQPRRISDFPDCFASWNYIASIGSVVSLVSLFLFIYIVYRQFTDKIPAITWVKEEYFNHRKIIRKVRTEALEFNTIGKRDHYHTYDELPLM